MQAGTVGHFVLLMGLWAIWEIIKYLGKKVF